MLQQLFQFEHIGTEKATFYAQNWSSDHDICNEYEDYNENSKSSTTPFFSTQNIHPLSWINNFKTLLGPRRWQVVQNSGIGNNPTV